jgi:hypothetical protein
MYKATTSRFINMGANGKRHVWMAMAHRSRFEQILAVVLTIVVWFRRRFGGPRPEVGRKNVRVVGQSKNTNW